MSALDEKKTFTALSFMPIIEPDLSIHATKKQLTYTTNSFKEWNYKFWEWKHGYRRRYSEEFLKRRGFEPETTGQTIVFNELDYNNYMRQRCSDYKETLERTINVVSPDYQMRWFLQRNANSWSNQHSLMDLIWKLDRVSFLDNNDPYEEDDESIIIGYFHNILSPSEKMEIDITNEFMHDDVLQVKCSHVNSLPGEWFLYLERESSLPSNIISAGTAMLTPVLTLKENGVQVKETSDLKKMMRKLNVDADAFQETLDEKDDDGEPAVDNAYLMNGLPLRNPYEVKAKYYSAEQAENLPYKLLHRIRVDQDSNEGYDVTEEIAEWFYTKHLREQAYLARGLFKAFAYYSGEVPEEATKRKASNSNYIDYVNDFEDVAGSEDSGMTFKSNHMSMRYTYNISVKTYEGKVREDVTDKRSQSTFHFSGKIISSPYEKDGKPHRSASYTDDYKGYDELKIQVQIDEDHYQEMLITGFKCVYKISGRVFNRTLGYPIQENKLIIPYFVLYNNKFTEYVTIYEHSLMFMAYSIKVIVVKWWKKMMGILLAALMCVFSAGAGCSVATFVFQLVVGYVAGYLLGKLLEMIDSEILKLIVQIAGMFLQMYMGGFDFSSITSEVYLKIAVKIGTMAINAYETQRLKDLQAEKREMEAEERITERMDNIASMTQIIPAMSLQAHTGLNVFGPDAFYAHSLGESLVNYDQYYNIDGEIELRKQVTAG